MIRGPLEERDIDDVVSALDPLREGLRNRRLLVTGATGFVGRSLVESLVAYEERLGIGLRVDAMSRNPNALFARAPHLVNSPVVRFLARDVVDGAEPAGAYDLVVHAAASSDAREYASRPEAMIDTIVRGTIRMLESTERADRFLYISSGAVYGRLPPDLLAVDETYVGGPAIDDPASTYAHAKRLAEHVCFRAAARSARIVSIARCFAFVGPFLPLDQHFAIGNFIGDALNGRPIAVAGDGTPFRSYAHSIDLVVALIRTLTLGATARAYNVGSSVPTTIGDLARRIAERAGTSYTIAERPAATVVASRYVPDTRRIERELGHVESVDLDDAIDRTLAFHRTSRRSRNA